MKVKPETILTIQRLKNPPPTTSEALDGGSRKGDSRAMRRERSRTVEVSVEVNVRRQ